MFATHGRDDFRRCLERAVRSFDGFHDVSVATFAVFVVSLYLSSSNPTEIAVVNGRGDRMSCACVGFRDPAWMSKL